MNVLTVNLAFTTFFFWIAARIYLVPRLAALGERELVTRLDRETRRVRACVF
jgi:hypothetical protein